MNTCDQDTAVSMSQALMNHAREINRYVKTYREPLMPLAEEENNRKSKFIATVERMVGGMQALMLMAKHKGISRYCNQEQIEAYVDEARAVIEAHLDTFRKSAHVLN